MGVEFELKYSASPERLEMARRMLLPEYTTTQMQTTYFDTPDRSLSQRHITLRLRRENGVSVCTVKTPLSGIARGEWECRCENIESSIERLCQLGAPAELLELTAGGVVPVCGAAFTRISGIKDIGTAVVEIALDQGVLIGGGREMPLCEMEMELKSGDAAQMADFARTIAQSVYMEPESRSKFRRALALARGEDHGL